MGEYIVERASDVSFFNKCWKDRLSIDRLMVKIDVVVACALSISSTVAKLWALVTFLFSFLMIFVGSVL